LVVPGGLRPLSGILSLPYGNQDRNGRRGEIEMSQEIQFCSDANIEPMVSSREVASKFGREHRRVLQDVKDRVMPFVPKQFGLHHFVQSTYTNEQGKNQPEILMSKDGFMLLAMGFTGEEAMVWKVKFIDAFNRALGSISELREELSRKEQVILHLQGKKRKCPRILAPNYNVFDGHEPKWELSPVDDLDEPVRTLSLLRQTNQQIVGLKKRAKGLKEMLGIDET
jgi:Rha family phage regulatory protein